MGPVTAVALPFVALLGACVGSFLNVVVYRLPRGESLNRPGSRCPACRAPIRPWDNVPILSWLVLRGRCRRCEAPISPRYPLVEALTTAAFVAVALARGVDYGLLLELPFVAVLIAVAGIDLEHRVVPNAIVVPAAIYAVAAAAAIDAAMLPELLIAGGAAFLALLLTALVHPAGMGMGDVKLAGMMGLYLGASVAPAMFVAFLAGALVGVAMLVRQGVAARKAGVPFAPFLAVGGYVGLLAGGGLIDLYLDRLA